MQVVVEAMQQRVFSAGEVVFQQGDRGDAFFVIAQGEARVVKRDEEGKEVDVALLGVNEFFGERALLYDETRAASVYAVSDLCCACISRHEFEELLGPLQDIIEAHSRLRQDKQARCARVVRSTRVRLGCSPL